MSARDDLLDALTAERYDNRWWTARPEVLVDDELTCRRRLAALVAEMSEHGDPREATA